MTFLYWVRRDLRLTDNLNFSQMSSDIQNLHIVFEWPSDFENWGVHRQRFFKECVQEFSDQLNSLGQKLFVVEEPIESWLQNISNPYLGLFFSKSFHHREKDQEQRVLELFNANHHRLFWSDQGTMIPEAELPFSIEELPIGFSKFRRKVEKRGVAVHVPQPAPNTLAKTMGVDWTLGARYFEQHLIDYDPESNWGNWAYLAGVGVDPRDREFNPDRQAQMYDPDKSYQKKFS